MLAVQRSNKPAELIAKFVDAELRGKITSQEELESTLDQALLLFRFISVRLPHHTAPLRPPCSAQILCSTSPDKLKSFKSCQATLSMLPMNDASSWLPYSLSLSLSLSSPRSLPPCLLHLLQYDTIPAA